jgi:MoaA/NifB/PqqE/SkfB family radical SAM enzyme
MNTLSKKLLTEISYFTGKYFLPPEFVSLQITFRCNLKCQTCSIWKKEFPELSDSEWLKIGEDINNFFPKKTFVEINGGEPLIRKDLVLQLINILKKKFDCVALNSNGVLIDEETIGELEKAGLDEIKISFYSLDKNIVKSLRGNEDAFEKTLESIKLLQGSKIKLKVGILITSENIDRLKDLITYLQKLKNCQIILQPLDEPIESEESKNLGNNNLQGNLWPSEEKVKDFFRWVGKNNEGIRNSVDNFKALENYYLNPKSALKRRCFAGQRGFMVYPDGDVSFCFKRKKIGNLKGENIAKILKSSDTVSERKSIRKCPKFCRISGCAFSRGIKEYFKI